MFKYFPTNYPWNLAVDLAIEMGARIGEIEAMCGPLQEAAQAARRCRRRGVSRRAGANMADKLCGLAEEDEARGRMISAGDKYGRAATYYLTAERLQAHGAPGRIALYRRFLDSLRAWSCDWRARIASGSKSPMAIAIWPRSTSGPRASSARAPMLVQLNGLDSTKEMKYRVGLPHWLAQRGVSSLIVDQPGTGEALRLQGLHAVYNSEVWASRIVDWLETRDDVDAKRIGMEGVSLGGYYCPRAVAFEPRFACGVVWGANHDWRDVQKKRLQREGNFPVPHYWEHVRWVWGAKDMDEFMRIAENVHLDGVLDRIKVPFLVTHGEKDSQIPLQWAHRTYEQLVNSPKRELKIFTDREGGAQHSSFDNSANAGAYIADWVAETLGGRTAVSPSTK